MLPLPHPFGHLASREPVHAYSLSGDGGLSAQVITYGGIVTHLRAPDRDGNLEDVVLGFDSFEPYLAGHPYFGAIAGRVAGRIPGGRLQIAGQSYSLALNDGPNHLHGGHRGLDKRVWQATPVARPDGAPSVRLDYHSPDGEEGYPGAVDLAVTYSVTPGNALLIETEASSDRPTPVNLTHHSYFNLAGEASGFVADHLLEIDADAFIPTDDDMTPLGRRESVAGRPNDFRIQRRLGDAIPGLFKRHGDLYLARRPPDSTSLIRVARLVDPASGRVLTASTTQTCVQFYTGISLDGSLVGKSGRAYDSCAGVCLECQGYPDGANNQEFGDIMVVPGQIQRHTISYAFSVEDA